MVTTTTNYSDSRYRAYPGQGYDGVVRVSFGGYYATGSLLFDGRAVLTAAHLFEGRTGAATVAFETTRGGLVLGTSGWMTHPGYDSKGNHDLALVWLADAAPASADRYGIYREADELGQVFALSGYGRSGTGSTGWVGGDATGLVRLKAWNRFDADAGHLKRALGDGMGWTPLAGTQLVADFDNGTAPNDALGGLLLRPDLGTGLDEGLIAPGDSGGPAFLGGKVAGLASYTAGLSLGSVHPDVDSSTNGSFGEVAGWQRVSAYQEWIDTSMRAHHADAPTRAEEVKKAVAEGNAGTGYVYFLLQFTGVRSDPKQVLSVDYATRDGTAEAGSDYLAVSGRLNLYAGQNEAVIPVEVVGDTTPEAAESFYLDVFNPVGGSFGEGVIRLTAVRTILDDDGWVRLL